MIKRISLIILIVSYIAAGINHFRIPGFYTGIIPNYMPHPVLLNTLAGLFEILFGLLLIPAKTRALAAWGIVLMLIAFIPVHTNMIWGGQGHAGPIKVSPLLAWLRLLLQPVLILWAWWHTERAPEPIVRRSMD